MSDDPSEPRPDDELLMGVSRGDAGALAALFRRRQRDVYGFALHMTGSAAVAEDITQEVFVAVMRDAGRFDPSRATTIAWLCGIARNHVKRRLERDRPAIMLDLEDAQAEVAGPWPDPTAELARARDIDAVRRAVASLPVRYREVIALCDLQELSYADAAAAIGCAVGTVRSRLHRGRALLALKLSAAHGTTGEPAHGDRPPRQARCST
jgi:RNA polymerase sigma-70 factor (ECF subfamily)